MLTSPLKVIFFVKFDCLVTFMLLFQADEAFHIGPSPAVDSYLRMEKIINVAKKSGAQVDKKFKNRGAAPSLELHLFSNIPGATLCLHHNLIIKTLYYEFSVLFYE